MAAQVKNFHSDSHSKVVSKNTPPRSSKMHMSSAKGEELLKALLRKRTIEKGNNNLIESKQVNDLKKIFISGHNEQNHSGKELLKVVRKGSEKVSVKESKHKSSTHSSKMCFCAPTTHEGSFRCRLHRKKSATDKRNVRFISQITHGIVEFQPQLSRFGRLPCAQVGTQDNQIKLSRVESV